MLVIVVIKESHQWDTLIDFPSKRDTGFLGLFFCLFVCFYWDGYFFVKINKNKWILLDKSFKRSSMDLALL